MQLRLAGKFNLLAQVHLYSKRDAALPTSAKELRWKRRVFCVTGAGGGRGGNLGFKMSPVSLVLRVSLCLSVPPLQSRYNSKLGSCIRKFQLSITKAFPWDNKITSLGFKGICT